MVGPDPLFQASVPWLMDVSLGCFALQVDSSAGRMMCLHLPSGQNSKTGDSLTLSRFTATFVVRHVVTLLLLVDCNDMEHRAFDVFLSAPHHTADDANARTWKRKQPSETIPISERLLICGGTPDIAQYFVYQSDVSLTVCSPIGKLAGTSFLPLMHPHRV